MVFEIILGCFLIIMSCLPRVKFYPARLGTKQKLPPIEPSWMMRGLLIAVGLFFLLDGISKVHR